MIKLVLLFVLYVAIFLFGMAIMRMGLYNLSNEAIKKWLVKVTDHPVKGLLAGMIVTAAIHSSSAVMVITVGLVAAGYLTFRQTIGIILGSNIGTTFTAEMITFDLKSSIPPLLICGALLLLWRNHKAMCTGALLFGLGCMFAAMKGFEYLAFPLSDIPFVHAVIENSIESNLWGILIGTVLTGFIQSSTAVTGIVMGFLNKEILTLAAGIAIVLGANIGTCVTALLSSIGSIKEAKRTAYAHLYLNVFGVLAFFPFIGFLEQTTKGLAASPDLQLAHSSVLFNVVCSLIALPFCNKFADFIVRTHR